MLEFQEFPLLPHQEKQTTTAKISISESTKVTSSSDTVTWNTIEMFIGVKLAPFRVHLK